MSRFATIVAVAKRGSFRAADKRTTEFAPDYIGLFQRLLDLLAAVIPPLKRSRAARDWRFFGAMNVRAPMILAAIGRFEEKFYQWEDENARYGMGSVSTRTEERAAFERAIALTNELRDELTRLGWPYRPIPIVRELVFSPWEGHTDITMAQMYWTGIMETFRKRAG